MVWYLTVWVIISKIKRQLAIWFLTASIEGQEGLNNEVTQDHQTILEETYLKTISIFQVNNILMANPSYLYKLHVHKNSCWQKLWTNHSPSGLKYRLHSDWALGLKAVQWASFHRHQDKTATLWNVSIGKQISITNEVTNAVTESKWIPLKTMRPSHLNQHVECIIVWGSELTHLILYLNHKFNNFFYTLATWKSVHTNLLEKVNMWQQELQFDSVTFWADLTLRSAMPAVVWIWYHHKDAETLKRMNLESFLPDNHKLKQKRIFFLQVYCTSEERKMVI